MRSLSELGARGGIHPPTAEQIREVEETYSKVLPTDYIEYLSVANGADLATVCFDYDLVDGGVGMSILSPNYHISEDHEDDFSVYKSTDFLGCLLSELGKPTNVLAIADANASDLIYLNFDDSPPSVGLFIQGDGIRRVANNFSEFVDKLYLPDNEGD